MNCFKLILFLVMWFVCFDTKSQTKPLRDNSAKIVVSMTGLGAAYEFNPAGFLYLEGGITSSFTVTRINTQAKLLFFKRNDFKIKGGVEAAGIFGDFKVGKVQIFYPTPIAFMPVFSFEGRVLGIEIPILVERNFNSIMPIIGVTLNISKDEPVLDEYGRPIPKPQKKRKAKKKSDDD